MVMGEWVCKTYEYKFGRFLRFNKISKEILINTDQILKETYQKWL